MKVQLADLAGTALGLAAASGELIAEAAVMSGNVVKFSGAKADRSERGAVRPGSFSTDRIRSCLWLNPAWP
jgi:hypothetical protein